MKNFSFVAVPSLWFPLSLSLWVSLSLWLPFSSPQPAVADSDLAGTPCSVLLFGAGSETEEMPKFLSSTGAPLSQAEAKAELLRLQQTYKGLNTFQASFVQRSYLKSLDLEETSEGRLALAFPGRLLWEYDKPEKQYFLLKGGEFQLYQPREKQLIIQSTEKFFLSDIPVAFLLGLGDLANDFRVQNGCRREKSVTLSLEPNRTSVRGAEDPLRELTLTFHQGEYLPVVAAVLDREGNKTSFALYGRRTDLPLSEKEFRLPVPEGTDVQDLR